MRALVISGGGSKGAYAVGVLKRLFMQFPGLNFDMFVGTSTGSLIVPLVALKEMGLLENLFTTQRTKDIVLENRLGDRLNDNSIFDATPLGNLLNTHYTDQRYQQLIDTGKKIFLTTVCLQSAELVVFTTFPGAAQSKYYTLTTLQNGLHFRRAVMASASQPIFMPPIKVNRDTNNIANPNFQFVDGGVREYAGIQMAIDNGATEVFSILLSSSNRLPENVEYKTLFPILQKTIDIFIEDVSQNDVIIPGKFNEALEYIEAVKKKMQNSGISAETIHDYFTIDGIADSLVNKLPIRYYNFRPTIPLGGGPGGLTFDPQEMSGMLAKGENTAENFIAGLDPADITWA